MIGYTYMSQNITQKLALERPIIFFDLETTGLNIATDRIVQLAYQKHFPDGTIESETMLFNPGRPIPQNVIDIHGITDEMVKDSPLFAEKAIELAAIFEDCYYSGFNIVRFDLPLLRQELKRAGQIFTFAPKDILDAKLVYNHMEPRDLSAAYRYYCKKEHTDAHDAAADVAVTAEILSEQIERYGFAEIKRIHEESCRDYVDNDAKFYRDGGDIYFAFSKFKGQPLAAVAKSDPTFLRWILQADFPEDTKDVVRNIINEQK